MGDDGQHYNRQYPPDRPGWHRDGRGNLRIGEAPNYGKRRTAWADRGVEARLLDVALMKTLSPEWQGFYTRGIGTTPDAIRAWAAANGEGDI